MKDDHESDAGRPAARPPLPAEEAAVAAARALIAGRQAEGRHHVAASVIDREGRVFTALNLESVLGQAASCAEPGALSMAFSADPPASGIVFACAVNRRGEVIPPCGLCRELMTDHAAEATVAIPGGSDFVVATLADLLPAAYKAGLRGG